jgi:hypothetical protein
MNTYLVSYDLRVPETSEDYKRLTRYFESYGYRAKPLKSVWFIKSDKPAEVIRDEISMLTDMNDGLLVIDVTGRYWATRGILNSVTDWMKSFL